MAFASSLGWERRERERERERESVTGELLVSSMSKPSGTYVCCHPLTSSILTSHHLLAHSLCHHIHTHTHTHTHTQTRPTTSTLNKRRLGNLTAPVVTPSYSHILGGVVDTRSRLVKQNKTPQRLLCRLHPPERGVHLLHPSHTYTIAVVGCHETQRLLDLASCISRLRPP